MYSKFTGGGNSGTWHKELLRDNHEFLMENMQVKDNKLLDILFGDRIIDEDVDEKVRQLPTNCDQTRQLLKELRKGRSKNYNGLLRALKKTGQHDVANELEMRRQEHMDGGKWETFSSRRVTTFLMFFFLFTASFPACCPRCFFELGTICSRRIVALRFIRRVNPIREKMLIILLFRQEAIRVDSQYSVRAIRTILNNSSFPFSLLPVLL